MKLLLFEPNSDIEILDFLCSFDDHRELSEIGYLFFLAYNLPKPVYITTTGANSLTLDTTGSQLISGVGLDLRPFYSMSRAR